MDTVDKGYNLPFQEMVAIKAPPPTPHLHPEGIQFGEKQDAGPPWLRCISKE